MIISKIFLFCLLRVLIGVTALGWHNVSRTEFQSVIKENDIALAAFIVPWTEPSKALEPEWSSAAAQSKKPLIAIDCTVETKLCEENGVISYPAIRLFKGGKTVSRYRGPRQASAIAAFVHRSTLPSVSILDSKNITAFESFDEAVFIAFLPPAHGDLRSTFTALASRNQGRFTFGFISDASFANNQNLPVPSIVCYKTKEGEQELFSGEWTMSALEEFIERATTPLIGEMTRRNEMKFLQAGKSLIYIFALTEGERSAYRSSLKPLAKVYQEYITFVTIDAVEYAEMVTGLGLKAGKFPAMALQNPILGQVFPFDQERAVTPGAVESFVLDIVQGNMKPIRTGGGGEGMAHDEL